MPAFNSERRGGRDAEASRDAAAPSTRAPNAQPDAFRSFLFFAFLNPGVCFDGCLQLGRGRLITLQSTFDVFFL
jgi:hypothetical protein